MIRPVSEPVGLEVRRDRLAAATDEAASTMPRTAFSTIIRESNDRTVVLMDRAGRTMAESRAGLPAFAALMSSLTALVLERFPADEWQDGDSVITNDPWIATGHLPDIAVISPVCHRGRLVAFAGIVAHAPDIGGAPAMNATELLSEGILIPPLRLFRAGRVGQGVKDLLPANVRPADQVWDDLEAQAAAHAPRPQRGHHWGEITRLLEETSTAPGDVAGIVHGTTFVAHTLLERTGAVVGLLTTRGFSDSVETGRETRFDATDLLARPAQPLAPRHLRRAVSGRIAADGRELEPLNDRAVRTAVRDPVDQGIEVLAVALMHSYRNAGHEHRVRDLVARAHPDLPVRSPRSSSKRAAPSSRRRREDVWRPA
ncbi:hydantoinase B/oxoprolinase family protein [Streptomyces sp. NPDC055186]